MTYHISSEQYQRGVDYIATRRATAAIQAGNGTAAIRGVPQLIGMAELLAHLASVTPARVMRDSDARLADLDSSLVGVNGTNPVCDLYDESGNGTGCTGCGHSLAEHFPVPFSR